MLKYTNYKIGDKFSQNMSKTYIPEKLTNLGKAWVCAGNGCYGYGDEKIVREIR